MAPGRAADVSQDSARCRADSEPVGSARPDAVKPMYMYGRVKGEMWAGEGPVTHWWEICHSDHTLTDTVSDCHHTHAHTYKELHTAGLSQVCVTSGHKYV